MNSVRAKDRVLRFLVLVLGSLIGTASVRGAPTDVIVPEEPANQVNEVLLEVESPGEAERLAKLGLTREQLKAHAAVREENLVERLGQSEAEQLRRLAT